MQPLRLKEVVIQKKKSTTLGSHRIRSDISNRNEIVTFRRELI